MQLSSHRVVHDTGGGMIKQLSYVEHCVVRILCALALLLVGFAHTPPSVARTQLSPSELAELVLPDGSLPVLCLPSQDGKAHNDHDRKSGCEACRLAASVLLPSPADALGERVLREADRFTPTRIEAFYRQLFPPNTSPRGPPASLTA